MALHPEFPKSPYAPLIPSHRWFPADETLRGTAYDKLLPPLVAKVREQVHAWRQKSYAGGSPTSVSLLRWWFETHHLVENADGSRSEFRYYFAQREAVETLIWLPRSLLTPASDVAPLGRRNHRISRVVGTALGDDEAPPRLWTAPTYTYYQDELFGATAPRKLLVFSGWRFVPKTVAIITSRVAIDRVGGEPPDTMSLKQRCGAVTKTGCATCSSCIYR